MSQYDDSGCKTFTANGAIPQYSRVVLESAGTVAVAAIDDIDIGTATRTAADGDDVSIRLRSAGGTHKMIAVEALACGATVYTENSGKVQDTAASTSYIIGTALEAATADGDIIEVLYNAHGDTAVS